MRKGSQKYVEEENKAEMTTQCAKCQWLSNMLEHKTTTLSLSQAPAELTNYSDYLQLPPIQFSEIGITI